MSLQSIYKKIGAGLLILAFLLPSVASAAWVAHESFEGYTDESDLAGQSGGSGWSAGWVNAATNLERADTATAYQGTVSARVVSGGGNTFYTRALTTAESGSGVMYVAMRNSVTNSGINSFTLRSNTGFRTVVQLNASGNLTVGSATLLAGYSANTWYLIRITYNVAAGTYTGAYWTGAAWSSETASQTMGNSGNLTMVGIGGDTGSGLSFVDYISGTNPIAAPVTNFQPIIWFD